MTATTDPTTAAPTLARTLAGLIAELTIEDVPENVLETAKQHALDALGIAVASSAMDFGESVHRAGCRLGASGESRAIGFGTSMPASSAALVNGTLIHGLDFDDTHIGAIYHATAPALAAALAAGEAQQADGANVLLALVIGMEVGCRLAAAGPGEFHARGFHPTAIIGTFAAACVTAKIRGLNAEQIANALGLCGSQAAGILELHESWLKRMHPGWAAHAGIVAATLAQEGFRGPPAVFEGPAGLYASHIGHPPTATALGLDHFGERWMTAEIALKPYTCCHFIHGFADAALALLDELGVQGLHPEEVTAIECPISPGLIPMVVEPVEQKIAPPTIYDALFSVQYVVASALNTSRVDLASFYDEPLDNPEVLAMAAKVVCTPDPASDFPKHFPGEVALQLADGRVLRRRIAASYGSHEDPMSDGDVKAKFMSNATRRLAPQQARQLAEAVQRLERLERIEPILDACAVPTP